MLYASTMLHTYKLIQNVRYIHLFILQTITDVVAIIIFNLQMEEMRHRVLIKYHSQSQQVIHLGCKLLLSGYITLSHSRLVIFTKGMSGAGRLCQTSFHSETVNISSTESQRRCVDICIKLGSCQKGKGGKWLLCGQTIIFLKPQRLVNNINVHHNRERELSN